PAAVLDVGPTSFVDGSEKETVLSLNESDLFGAKLVMPVRPGFKTAISASAAPAFLQLLNGVGGSDFQVTIWHRKTPRKNKRKLGLIYTDRSVYLQVTLDGWSL